MAINAGRVDQLVTTELSLDTVADTASGATSTLLELHVILAMSQYDYDREKATYKVFKGSLHRGGGGCSGLEWRGSSSRSSKSGRGQGKEGKKNGVLRGVC